jgi:hypothetical protein
VAFASRIITSVRLLNTWPSSLKNLKSYRIGSGAQITFWLKGPGGTRRYLGDQLWQATAGRTVPVDYRALSVRAEMP